MLWERLTYRDATHHKEQPNEFERQDYADQDDDAKNYEHESEDMKEEVTS